MFLSTVLTISGRILARAFRKSDSRFSTILEQWQFGQFYRYEKAECICD